MSGPMQRILGGSSDSADEATASAETTPVPDPDTQATTPSSDPGFLDRGKLRRRLRYLRRARELGYRDLGGLVFDLRRFERDRSDLVDAKVAALRELDDELRAIETALEDRRPINVLREPGISECQKCGALHSSADRFCAQCGVALQATGDSAPDEPKTED